MAAQVTNYQCPACGGPLQFEADGGKLGCEYCGSSFTVADVEALYADKDAQAAQNLEEAEAVSEQTADGEWDASSLSDDWGADADGMRAYNCPSCGAELLCDATTAATSCPYCANPTIVPGQLSGMLKPDFVIPFKLKKEEAVKALKKHYEGKKLLPNSFKDSNHLEEIKGVYVPFWLFDGEAEGKISYAATRSRTYRSGDYEVTETRHFNVHREGSVRFERIPVDASSKCPTTTWILSSRSATRSLPRFQRRIFRATWQINTTLPLKTAPRAPTFAQGTPWRNVSETRCAATTSLWSAESISTSTEVRSSTRFFLYGFCRQNGTARHTFSQ